MYLMSIFKKTVLTFRMHYENLLDRLRAFGINSIINDLRRSDVADHDVADS